MPRRQHSAEIPNFGGPIQRSFSPLLKLPPQLNLTTRDNPDDEKSGDVPTHPTATLSDTRPGPNITGVPPEIILEIVGYLPPIDRICLGLTCKSLLSSTLQTLHFTERDRVRFLDRQYSYVLPHISTLYTRLAHGWLPKDRFRYCCRCYRILPRNAEYFRHKLRRKKSPRFNSVVGVTEKEWKSMSKKQRYAHLVRDWCLSPKEDSSSTFCEFCARRDPDKKRYPIYCPLCMETDLTWCPPRKPWVRKTLWRCVKAVWRPFELIIIWTLFCCVWSVKFVYDEGKRCLVACAGLCCSC